MKGAVTIKEIIQFLEKIKISKLGIVFDNSAKENGPSLNELLYKGPQLLSPQPPSPCVFHIFISFKTYAIALTSGIKMVFHQISAHEKDRKILKVL